VGYGVITRTNMVPHGPMTFRLTRLVPTVRRMIRGDKQFQPVHLRRVIIEPDANRLVMLWHACVNCGPDRRIVQKVTIDQHRIMRAVA
jgi:hypothetical protein